LEVIQRQAEHEAEGKRRRGRRPKATLSEQKTLLTQMTTVMEGVRYLCQELHTLLEVVVPHADLVLSSTQRQGEIEAVLELLDELALLALPALQGHIETLAKQIRLALPQALLFARRLDALQEQAVQALGPEAVALLAWAWLRRAVLGPTSKHLLQGIRPTWQAVASELLAAWDQAVRASSAVENWQSIVRPHLAVHRTLSAGFLSLLAVWHNRRIAPRGLHAGLSPILRTGSTHPILHGWQLWAILFSLLDCSNVSHGFEPCLRANNIFQHLILKGNLTKETTSCPTDVVTDKPHPIGGSADDTLVVSELHAPKSEKELDNILC
jgi:hypothetical protein